MGLRHIRLLPSAGRDLVSYAEAVEAQTRQQHEFLNYKASLQIASPATAQLPPPPPPTLLSFAPAPTYTLGRRQTSPLTPQEEQRLRAPLRVVDYTSSSPNAARTLAPEIAYAPRGGLVTYHGPGQVVLWPVIDLRSPLHRAFSVREYACLLEKTTIAALAAVTRGRDGIGSEQGIQGLTTKDPGVWVRHAGRGLHVSPPTAEVEGDHDERKIAALGVHLRRHITGLGVAVNVGMPVSGPEASNPWARIVACGLEDKRVTSVAAELYGEEWHEGQARRERAADVERLRGRLVDVWAAEFEQRLCFHR